MPVLSPRTIDDACLVLHERPGSTILAGGTDLMVAVNSGRRPSGDVLSIGRIDELRTWRRDGGSVVLGAGVTYADILGSDLALLLPVLAQAARSVGSPQIRNAGTIGGNLGTASPAGDGSVALLALGGTVLLRSAARTREVDLSDFFLGPRSTARGPDELIVGVRVPVLDGAQEFCKIGTRNAMVIAIASLAVVVDGSSVRVALGSVAPTPVRARDAEAYIEHGGADPVEFGQLVAGAAQPIDDHRASASYRRRAVAVLARRALERVR